MGILLAATVLGTACHTSYAFRAIDLAPVAVQGLDHSGKSSLRFLTFGDSGSGDRRQMAVAAGMAEACRGVPCDFGLLLGDNIYDAGIRAAEDPQFRTKFHDAYDALGLEFWLAPGNHDWYSAASLQPAIDHSTAPGNTTGSWKMPFNYFGVPGMPPWLHLFALDTTVFHDLAGESDPVKRAALEQVAEDQLQRAREQLCGRDGWRVLFGHHFIYSNGSAHNQDSGRIAPWLEPLIAECGVQLYLAGHDHHLEHLVAAGYDQVIAGAASEHRSVRRTPVAGAQQMFAAAELGFAVVSVSASALSVEFVECGESGPCRSTYEASVPQRREDVSVEDVIRPRRTTARPAAGR